VVPPYGAFRLWETRRPSGTMEVWTSQADGSNPQQLTSLGATVTGCPRWSPDGSSIVFDSNHGGRFRLYSMSAVGGTPRPLTDGGDEQQVVPLVSPFSLAVTREGLYFLPGE
jgi:Tol biopolymer transport system component